MDSTGTLAELYGSVKLSIKNQGTLDFEEFQNIHRNFIKLSELIESSDLYSENDKLSELATSTLKYLLIPYEHAKFLDSHAVSSQLGPSAQPQRRNKLRLLVLEIVEGIIWKFLSLLVLKLDIFENCEAETAKLFVKWVRNYANLREREIAENGVKGYVKLDEFERVQYSDGPMARREMKISKWKQEKELSEKVKIIEDEDTFKRLDAQVVRKVRMDQLQLAVIDSISLLENYSMEREMLSSMVGRIEELDDIEIEGSQLKRDNENSDSRMDAQKDNRFDKGYTDKLERLDVTKDDLISKEGKILRPFTIVSSDEQRKNLQSKVMGTGQVLPSMTVEELVDYELANGGMVKPQDKVPEIDEDDEAYQDKETYRLRDWDNFTDSHKKGSGNKMGNLG